MDASTIGSTSDTVANCFWSLFVLSGLFLFSSRLCSHPISAQIYNIGFWVLQNNEIKGRGIFATVHLSIVHMLMFISAFVVHFMSFHVYWKGLVHMLNCSLPCVLSTTCRHIWTVVSRSWLMAWPPEKKLTWLSLRLLCESLCLEVAPYAVQLCLEAACS